jgi:hypothetical protein
MEHCRATTQAGTTTELACKRTCVSVCCSSVMKHWCSSCCSASAAACEGQQAAPAETSRRPRCAGHGQLQPACSRVPQTPGSASCRTCHAPAPRWGGTGALRAHVHAVAQEGVLLRLRMQPACCNPPCSAALLQPPLLGVPPVPSSAASTSSCSSSSLVASPLSAAWCVDGIATRSTCSDCGACCVMQPIKMQPVLGCNQAIANPCPGRTKTSSAAAAAHASVAICLASCRLAVVVRHRRTCGSYKEVL